MSFLLDTCVVSELVRQRPDPGVIRWLDQVEERRLYVSVLTLGELAKGVAKLPETPRRNALQEWLEHDLVERFAGRIVPVDDAVALAWGRLQGEAERAGVKLPVIDSLLVATAECHALTVVTRNVADFEKCGANTCNPWEA